MYLVTHIWSRLRAARSHAPAMAPAMRTKLTSDRAAVVAPDMHWLSVAEAPPPRGAKVLLINRSLGTATLGHWSAGSPWTHWFPLPTFKKEHT